MFYAKQCDAINLCGSITTWRGSTVVLELQTPDCYVLEPVNRRTNEVRYLTGLGVRSSARKFPHRTTAYLAQLAGHRWHGNPVHHPGGL